MSIAWSTLAGLVLLAPGFSALFGYYIPKRSSRDIDPQRALTLLSTLVVVSLVVHILGVKACDLLASFGLPVRVDLGLVLRVITLDSMDNLATDLAPAIEGSLWRFLAYFLITVALGGLLGFVVGGLVTSGPLQKVAMHGWAYRLNIKQGITYAYVLTNVQHDDKIVMYRGALRDFHIGPTGCISYLVLLNPSRYFMILDGDVPTTTKPDQRVLIGEDSKDLSVDDEFQFLMIEGEDIANVVFHRHHGGVTFSRSQVQDSRFDDLRKRLQELIEKEEEKAQ